jgi:hypothetical protein
MDEFIQKLDALLKGESPGRINLEEISDLELHGFADRINRLIDCIKEIKDCLLPLSRGVLKDIQISANNFMASPFKALHSSLLHLTWQAREVAKGDYCQRVDFMGDFSNAFNAMVVALDTNEKLLKNKIFELERALGHIRKLEGILPICSHCKKIRIEGAEPSVQGNWMHMEQYIEDRSEAKFSHSLCPECVEKYYPEKEKV